MTVLLELIGNSHPMVAVREEVTRLLERQDRGRALPPILIQGETGTGKGLLAGAIHRAGPRRDSPFIAVNCAAIPDTLLEAELFGFERGAFTDARQAKPGLVQTAHHGTLFLDEINLLPGPLQGKLLTVLEDHAVRRLGRTRSEPVDVAILTATSEDLERAVRERRFTEALYHRLSVLTLRLPPLRERGADILLLADHFLARAAAAYHTISPRALTHEACAALLAYPWPGNVRELSNRMERVTLLAEPGLVTCQMLGLPETPLGDARGASASPGAEHLRARIDSLERESLIAALTATGGNITRAAARLGVPPTTLRYRIKRHRLVVESLPGVSAADPGEQAAGPRPHPSGDAVPPTGPLPTRARAGRPPAPPHDKPTDGGLGAASRRVALEGEHRQLTVMACGVAGSPARPGPLDPEDLHEALRDVQTACAEVIRRFEGHVAQYRGDRFLVYFGSPLAHEDDARRAVHAGLEVVEAVRELSRRLERERGIRLATRVGVHTGQVVVGGMGTDTREHVALGEPPDLAVQLSELAEPETVVISPGTYRLIEGYFACQALGVPGRTGVSPPGPVYRVLQSTAASRLDAGVTTGLTPLVGREQEVGLLLERWEQANEGRGQVVLLSGEPGIGKSRLVQVLDQRLAGEPPARLEFRCSAYHQNSALYPVIDNLQRLLHFTRDHSAQQKLSTLEAALEGYGFSLDEAMPLFAPLLALPLPDRYRPPSVTPERRKQQTLEALLAWLLKEAERHVTLAVWEDLQWVDPSTLELLGLLVEEASTASILILLTFRPEFSPPWPPRSHLTHVPLGRLPRKQVELMIEKVAGGRPLPGEVLQQLVAKTDGVPLFVEELTKMVLESGLLAERVGRYELTGPLAPLAIPSTLHDSLTARLDRLGPGKEVAQLGATVGREFSYELIREVSSSDEETLQRELARLVEAELLFRSGVPPQARFVFKHALIRDAAYQSLLRSTQRQYHRQIARALEDRFPEASRAHPELLAHHYAEAGLKREAVVYWQRAGQSAIERSANQEAVGHLSQALAVLTTSPDTPERAQHELTLQLTLGASLVMIKGYRAPEVEDVYTRARELHPRVGDSPQRFSALFGLWRFHSNRAELQTAHELGEECFALARRLHDPALLLQAHFALGVASFHLGEFASALADLEQAIALYDPREHAYLAFLHGADPGVACRCYVARVLWFLGYPDQALVKSQEAMALARQSSHTSTLGFALHLASTLHTYRRDVEVVRQLADATIALANDQGFVRWLGSGLVRRGWALAQQGSPEEGIEQLRQGLTTWQALGALGLSHFLALLAEAYQKGGQPDAGLRVVDEALAVTHSDAERHYEAELHRLKGELLLQQDPGRTRPAASGPGPAETCFHRAIDLAGRTRAKSLELRAVTSLSRLWQAQGRRFEAHRVLAQTYGWFTEGFDTPDLQEARALLEALA